MVFEGTNLVFVLALVLVFLTEMILADDRGQKADDRDK